MLDERLQAVLLIGGLVLVGLGVVVGLVLMIVAIVRRQRREPAESPQLGAAFLEPAAGAEDEQPFRFIAERPPTGEGAGTAPAWSDLFAAEEEAGGTSSFFAPAVPPRAEAPTVAPHADTVPQPIAPPTRPEEGVAPLVNPWLGTGPQPPAGEAPVSGRPAAFIASPPGAEHDALRIGPPPSSEAELSPVAAPPARVPLADSLTLTPRAAAAQPLVPASSGGDPTADADGEEDRTVILGRGAPAPWLLVLDTGERIGVPADSVVVGRRTQPVEDGRPGVRIPDATKTVSKVHARLDRLGEHWTISDLGSTNGCTIIGVDGRERRAARDEAEEIRGRFLLGEVGMILVRNPEWTAA